MYGLVTQLCASKTQKKFALQTFGPLAVKCVANEAALRPTAQELLDLLVPMVEKVYVCMYGCECKHVCLYVRF